MRTSARAAAALVLGLLAVAVGDSSAPANGDAVEEARPEGSPAARLAHGDEASEYWDLAASFDSGHQLFARFQISNEGPGDRTAYALGHVRFPDGRTVPFQNGRLEGSWRISQDRLRLAIGSSVLDLHGPPHHFEVDKNKKGIKLFLDYDGTGKVRPWTTAPDGYHLDLLTLGAPARGTFWIRDVTPAPVPVSGSVTVTHAWMNESEFELARLRVEPHGMESESGDVHVYALGFTPKTGPARSWMVIRKGLRWLETDGFDLARVGRNASSEKEYPIPTQLLLDGEDVRGRIDIGRMLLRHDPLALAPGPFRWLLSFRTEPSQVWLESRYAIEWLADPEPMRLEGSGVSSFYYLNPWK